MPAAAQFRIERLVSHDRKPFSCGNPKVDSWFVTMAGQQQARGLAVVHLLIERETALIAGFFSLSNYTVRALDLPDLGGKALPKAMPIPMHLLGWLGVQQSYQGRGIGKMLVSEATRIVGAQAAASGTLGLVVNALDIHLSLWYQSLGFVPFPADPLQLVMSMKTIGNQP